MPMFRLFTWPTERSERLLFCLLGVTLGFCFTFFYLPYLSQYHWKLRRQLKLEYASETNQFGGPSILCWITSMPSNHEKKAKHIKATWAKRCDKYIFMSSVTDPSLPSIAAVPFESREMLWNKTQFALNYISKTYGEKFDYFFKADDDTYVIVENLRKLLSKYNPEVPLLMGYKHQRFFRQGYPSGGAGYILSRAALRKMVKEFETTEGCFNSEHISAEDAKVGMCAQSLGIPLVDSRDRRGYHHFVWESPFQSLRSRGLSAPYNFLPDRKRVECCAEHMVAFHYIKPHELYFLDYLIYNVLRSPPEE